MRQSRGRGRACLELADRGAGAWPALIERWGKAVKPRQRVAELQKPHFTGAALARCLD